MDSLEFHELNAQEMKAINGGYSWACFILIAEETVDVITSNGENLKEAYENGRAFGESL